MPNETDWAIWEKHVLSELKRLNTNIEKVISDNVILTQKYFDMREELTKIKVKIAMVAGSFGFIGSLVVPLLTWLLSSTPWKD